MLSAVEILLKQESPCIPMYMYIDDWVSDDCYLLNLKVTHALRYLPVVTSFYVLAL